MGARKRTAETALFRLVAVAALAAGGSAADWPQFMRSGAHTGGADDEALALPLGLVAQVKLGDAVLTSPAVVAGRVYIVDQMGTACCVDPWAGRVLWSRAPDGEQAMGSNTSSPCVVRGRVYYGTTAGRVHILNGSDGALVRTIEIGAPVVSALTAANRAIYFQALDGVVRCLDLDGNEKWTWDHYRRYSEPAAVTAQEAPRRGHPGSYDRPHYGGGEVAVSNRRVVTSLGWDLVCLDDGDTAARLVWCRRAPAGRDGAIPMSPSISGGSVYVGGVGADGVLALMRFSLVDGESQGSLNQGAFPWTTAAVRDGMVTCRNNGWLRDEIQVADFGKRRITLWQDRQAATPVVSSPALAGEHLLVTTLTGELLVLDLTGRAKAPLFRFRTPNGRGVGSSPVVADGRVFFGCDDGYLYILGPGGDLEPVRDKTLTIHQARSRVVPATGRRYEWPSTCANPANTSCVDDPGLAPPLRVRWATRGFGHFKTPCVTTREDLITVTLDGTVSCQEQMTGRLRWRRRVPPESPGRGNSSGLLAADGRLYVPRPNNAMEGSFLCLDLDTGDILWTAPIGGRGIWERSSAVPAAGRVAFGHTLKGAPPRTLIQAWDAETGKEAWQVELNVSGSRAGSLAGCTDGRVMYFTAGAEAWQWKQEGDRQRGETVAIDAATGTVLWRSNEVFGTSCPVLAGDRLLLCERGAALYGADPADGRVLWKNAAARYDSRFSVGPDFIAMRGYGGSARKIRTEDGAPYPGLAKGGQLGGDTHACGAVALTPTLSIAITVGGLNVRDATSGELLWLSPGFAPRGCVNATLANGRVFFPSAASGMIFSWEGAPAPR